MSASAADPFSLVVNERPLQPTPGNSPEADGRSVAERASRYVPRMLQRHLAEHPDARCWTSEGTAAFIDISGFTQLSERLARKGREGAEQITEVIGKVFEAMLAVAYENGGSLIKFGGDALLLWFEEEGHAARACHASVRMRDVLREVGQIALPEADVTLRMSQGIHSGRFHFFAVGTSHLELLATGAAWTHLVAIENAADAGEILVGAATATGLPDECLGEAKGVGRVLRREPPDNPEKMPLRMRPPLSLESIARCIPAGLRAHILGGGGTPEHRPVTIAFIRFEGTDVLIERNEQDAAEALHRLVSAVETAAAEQGVAFLASDVDADGGKLILTAGAPKITGDDEERMLLALRKIVDAELPIPVRLGVHRGAVFAGDIGPPYRRAYTVMGDAVNLTARLMAKAEPGHIYATAEVLDRSKTVFEAAKLEPFAVKGKAEPVQAWSIGRAQASRTRQVAVQRLPLTGRNAELGVIRKAFASARSGSGRLVEVVGEAGVGKTRLLEALRDAAAGFRKLHAACEAYTAATPYALWTELLRESMEFGRDVPAEVVVERLRSEVATRAPDLAPWLSLIGIALGVEIAPTPEVELLEDRNRRAKLHESVGRFLEVILAERTLFEIENAHHMDEASAELVSFLATQAGSRPWLFAVARRPAGGGFTAPEAPTVLRVELKALAVPDALRLAQLATEQSPLPEHVLDLVAKRSGGNPQFLRDLLQTAIASGGVADLPDSAEAAAMAQVDALTPEDRALVRRASVFGNTFHPRMLAWFADDADFRLPDADTWARLGELFDEEPDGYLRFRRSLLRDAAYEGLPFKLRRRLHALVATRLEEELDFPEDAGDTLSLHYFEAGEFRQAWSYARIAARRAEEAYAYVEAAGFHARALEAGRQLADLAASELAAAHEGLGDAWHRAGEYQKALAAYAAGRPLAAADALAEARILLQLSYVEGKLGKYAEARRWAQESRDRLQGVASPEAARHVALSSARYAEVLQVEGRTAEALEWAERAKEEAETAGDFKALGDACFVMGRAHLQLGRGGAEALMQRSLEAYQRAGSAVREAAILSDLGVVYQLEGRWDDALSSYGRSRDAALKVGSTYTANLARLNVAEVLIDRGEWAEAEAVLLETLSFWKASQFRYFLAACLTFLGRVSLHLGRHDEAMGRLEEARTSFLEVGAQDELPPVDARIAECRLAAGNADAAVEQVNDMLSRAGESSGVARVVPLLERIKGHALMKQGDLWGARDALEASLAAAEERNQPFEAALTKLSLIELDRLEGVEPPLEMVNESRSLLASLKVRAVPPVPQPAA
jgi:class 3 adenylate cyclase/tetratricopeptide (TPR) repeat protein